MNDAAWDDRRVEISCVTADCYDPGRLAEFWSEALGWEIAHVAEDGAYCRPREGGVGLEFIKVNEPKTVKNRLHLGTRTDDIDAEVQRLVMIGAALAWEEEFPPEWPYRNVVLRDPEENEFCLGNEPPRA